MRDRHTATVYIVKKRDGQYTVILGAYPIGSDAERAAQEDSSATGTPLGNYATELVPLFGDIRDIRTEDAA